jgi:hypothetical protein
VHEADATTCNCPYHLRQHKRKNDFLLSSVIKHGIETAIEVDETYYADTAEVVL